MAEENSYTFVTTDYMVTVESSESKETAVEYIIQLGDVGLPGRQGEQGEPGYSPVVDYIWNTNTIQFTLTDQENIQTTPNLYDYVAKKDLSNTSIATNYLKVDGSNATNPITLNNLTIRQVAGGGSRLQGGDTSRIQLNDTTSYIQRTNTQGLFLNTNNTYLVQNGNYLTGNNTGWYYKGGTNPVASNEIATIGDIPDISDFITNSELSTTLEDYLSKTEASNTYLNTTGSNASDIFSINNNRLVSNGIYSSNTTGTSLNLQAGSYNASLSMVNTNANKYGQLALPDFYLTSYPEDLAIILNANNAMYINRSSSTPVYYHGTTQSNELATLGDIPSVSDATITINQGGETKGTFTLNGSETTIELDAGGSSIENPITVSQEIDGVTKTLEIGLDENNKLYSKITSDNGTDITEINVPVLYRPGNGMTINYPTSDTYATVRQFNVAVDGITIDFDGANQLHAIPPDLSSYLQNTATNTDTYWGSLTILGNSSGANDTNCINIGVGSSIHNIYDDYIVSARNCVAIGNNSEAGPYDCMALGDSSHAEGQACIQLGAGRNTTNQTLQVYDYTLLNLQTGKIPDDRISTNIQRTLVSGSNIKTINGQSLLGSGNITIEGGGSSTDTGSTIPTNLELNISNNTLIASPGYVKGVTGNLLTSTSAIATADISTVENGVNNGVILGDTTGYQDLTFNVYLVNSNDTLDIKLTNDITSLSAYTDYALIGNIEYDSLLSNPIAYPDKDLATAYLTHSLVTVDDLNNMQKSINTLSNSVTSLEARVSALEALINGGGA